MQEIVTFISEAWKTLSESFAIKAVLAIIAEVAIYILGLKHIQVLGIFIILVFLDLITRWSAISYRMLIDMGANPDNISSWDKYVAIPAAWGKGLISSKHMRKPFVTKVLTYCLATGAAWCFDYMAGQYAFAVNLMMVISRIRRVFIYLGKYARWWKYSYSRTARCSTCQGRFNFKKIISHCFGCYVHILET